MEITITIQLEDDLTDKQETELLKRVKIEVSEYIQEISTKTKGKTKH